MRTALLILSLLLLSGCYESQEQLLNPNDPRQPITTYQDWNYGSGDHRYHAKLTPRSDGWYDYDEAKLDESGNEGEWKHHLVLLNYLTPVAGYDTFAFSTWDDTEHAYVYGVVAVGANGFWQSVTPSCDPASGDEDWVEHDKAHAREAGAEMKSDGSEICLFSARDQLLQALRAVVSEPGFADRVRTAAK